MVFPWEEQRPLRVARAQAVQRLLEFIARLLQLGGLDVAESGLAFSLIDDGRHFPGAHAQAAAVVDGGGGAFQLPGQQQRIADGEQRENHRAQQHAGDLGGEPGFEGINEGGHSPPFKHTLV